MLVQGSFISDYDIDISLQPLATFEDCELLRSPLSPVILGTI